MIRTAFFSTMVCSALIASPALATGSSSSAQDNAPTAGQQRSDPSNAGTEAASQPSTTTSGEIASDNSPQGLNFEELDRDGDGKLDEDELNRYGSTAAGNTTRDTDQGEQMLDLYDRDNDDALTEEELEGGPKSRTGMDPAEN